MKVRGAVELCDRLGIDYFKEDSFRTFNVSSREGWRFLNDRDSSRRLHNDPDRLLMYVHVHVKVLILEICSRRSDDCGGSYFVCANSRVTHVPRNQIGPDHDRLKFTFCNETTTIDPTINICGHRGGNVWSGKSVENPLKP